MTETYESTEIQIDAQGNFVFHRPDRTDKQQ